jgi:hypothetical protein
VKYISPDTTWPAAGTRAKAAAAREPDPPQSIGTLIHGRRAARARAPSVRRGGDGRRGSEHFSAEAISQRYKDRGQT